MGPISVTKTIDAPRERVFALVADLAKRPAFTDHFLTDFHLQRIESTGVGAAARFQADAPRFSIWMESVIAELEPPYRLIERGHGSRADRMAVGTAWELVEDSSGTTGITVSFWTEPENTLDKFKGMLGAERWYAKQWRQALERLAALAESGVEVESLRIAGGERLY